MVPWFLWALCLSIFTVPLIITGIQTPVMFQVLILKAGEITWLICKVSMDSLSSLSVFLGCHIQLSKIVFIFLSLFWHVPKQIQLVFLRTARSMCTSFVFLCLSLKGILYSCSPDTAKGNWHDLVTENLIIYHIYIYNRSYIIIHIHILYIYIKEVT